jgi:hypothetical protein
MKPNIYSVVDVHPQLSHHNGHPVDGVLVGAGSLCQCVSGLGDI